MKALLGNTRATIVGDPARNIAIAAAHQDVGHRLAQRAAPRDRVQVRLTFGFGDVDEIGFRQTRCELQHRPGDGDIVVLGQAPQHFHRCVADLSETVREFGASLVLNLLDQQPEHFAKDIDVLVFVTAGAVDKKGCDALQRLGPLFAGAVLNHVFEFGNERKGGVHSLISSSEIDNHQFYYVFDY